MPRDVYTSDQIAPPVGPFSPAVRGGELLYLSGQVAQDPSTGKLVEGGIDAQASQVLRNVAAVLEAAGRGFDDVVRVGVYLRDMADFKAMNADFLICRTCGTYVAAVMEIEGRSLGVLNVSVLDEREPFARPPTPMEYGAEQVENREARRAKAWMPAEVRVLSKERAAEDSNI